MKLLKYLLFVPILLMVAAPTFAQDDEEDEEFQAFKTKKFDWSKFHIGGNFGILFGKYTFVELSPLLAYRVHDRIQMGGGPIYQFINDQRDIQIAPGVRYAHYKSHVIGGRLFHRVFVWDQLFAQIEGLLVNARIDVEGFSEVSTQTLGNVLVGAGYNVEVGASSYLTIAVMVNLIENDLYPQRQPFFTFGFGIGLGN